MNGDATGKPGAPVALSTRIVATLRGFRHQAFTGTHSGIRRRKHAWR